MAETEYSREKRLARKRAWRAAHPEKVKAYNKAWYAANSERSRERTRLWRVANLEKWRAQRAANPGRRAFDSQKALAQRRGIPFLLTFDEWWAIWQASGKWEQKGTRKGRYVMARFMDQGGYAIGNVRICTVEENRSDQTKYLTAETRRKLSVAKLGRAVSAETRQRMAAAQMGKKASAEARQKMAAAKRGGFASAETRQKMSAAQKARWEPKKSHHDLGTASVCKTPELSTATLQVVPSGDINARK